MSAHQAGADADASSHALSSSETPMHPCTILLRAVLLAALPCIALAQSGEEVNAVARLQRAGDTTLALQRAEQFLAVQPGDAAMRFLKGTLLADAGRSAEAMAQWRALTEEHPELAEPYNNIAVLHAALGHYDEALAALQTALRNRPDYAVALENLGRVHMVLARQAYARAQRMSPDNVGVADALTYLRAAPAAAEVPARRPNQP
jgi:tetratricopeptide (TPR) repeat protein